MRPCPQNYTVRNVWRASFPDRVSLPNCMLKIYSNSYAFAHTCPPDHTVRNVWRTPPFGSVEPLGPPVGRQGHQGCPKTPEPVHLGTVWAVNVTQGCLPDITSACLRLRLNLRLGIFSVAGGAMHMKCPDDIGREAGIGRTRNGKELSVFRACPW